MTRVFWEPEKAPGKVGGPTPPPSRSQILGGPNSGPPKKFSVLCANSDHRRHAPPPPHTPPGVTAPQEEEGGSTPIYPRSGRPRFSITTTLPSMKPLNSGRQTCCRDHQWRHLSVLSLLCCGTVFGCDIRSADPSASSLLRSEVDQLDLAAVRGVLPQRIKTLGLFIFGLAADNGIISTSRNFIDLRIVFHTTKSYATGYVFTLNIQSWITHLFSEHHSGLMN